MRTDRYKLIEYYTEGPYWELFDLQEDPNEVNNRYEDPALSEVREELTQRLRETQTAYADV